MDKNYKVVFTEKGKVELVEWEMPKVGDKDIHRPPHRPPCRAGRPAQARPALRYDPLRLPR